MSLSIPWIHVAFCAVADPAVRVHGAGLRRRAGVPGATGFPLARRLLEQEVQPRALAGVQEQAVQGIMFDMLHK